MKKLFLNFVLVLFISVYLFSPKIAQAVFDKTIYADELAAGWDNWSWAETNLTNNSPVYSGIHSIAVDFGAWEGLYLHNPGIDTLGTSDLRFFIHGGSSGGQTINLFFNLVNNGVDQIGPGVMLLSPVANIWQEQRIPINMLNPQGYQITGITWQGGSATIQPTVYFDDIAFINNEDINAPQITDVTVSPRSIPADGSTVFIIKASVSDPQGSGDIVSVSLDAGQIGLGTVILKDDGMNNDGLIADGSYGAALTIAPGTPTGEKRLLLSAGDQSGHLSQMPVGTINVLALAGGLIPQSLPQRLGWGSNAWSETPGQDWQVNSAVPWDYVYQYITYGWESWGPNFVERFVNQAWDKGYVPMITVYMILGTPPDCGEGGSCYASKLQNADMVQNYLASLHRAALEAVGSNVVIFNLEPDFYGYMQQLSNDSSRPTGVIPNDPASYPVALNISGYPNNLAGFGQYLVDMVHTTAPNALVAPMASMWATNNNPQNVTADQAIQMAQSTAEFIDDMGGAQSDLLIVEWSDRDAGFYEILQQRNDWWDNTDMDLPRHTRAILWENALLQASAKRLLLWQVPVGNMSLDNTCGHYRDNRAAYLFQHPRDMFDAGVIGILFGGGADCTTQVTSDGGFVAAQGAIAYEAPATPYGLTNTGLNGAMLSLKWNESIEPDLWEYHIHYKKTGEIEYNIKNVSRMNSTNLLIPNAGDWEIRVSAIDALGLESPLSEILQVTTSIDSNQVFLPFIHN